jgi:hypothetical protein
VVAVPSPPSVANRSTRSSRSICRTTGCSS